MERSAIYFNYGFKENRIANGQLPLKDPFRKD